MQARTAYLDPSFGRNGKVTTGLDLERQWSQAFGESAPHGEIVVAAGKVVVRYLADGRLDPSFGSDGIVHIGDPEGLGFSISDLAVDAAGRVLVFGTAVDHTNQSSAYFAYPAGTLSTSYAMVLRYAQDGRLDPSFGEGDGIVRTTFGLPQDQTYKVTAATAASGALDSSGRIVVIGGTTESVTPCMGHAAFGRHDRLVARLTPEGRFDPTFGGGDGIIDLGGFFLTVDGMSPTEDGETLLFGTPDPCRESVVFLRIGAGGTPDPAQQGSETRFSIAQREMRGIGQDRHRRLLVLSSPVFFGPRSSYDGSLQRLANGKPDRSFGKKGKTTFKIPGGASRVISAELDPRGRILVAGSLVASKPRPKRTLFTLLRFNAAGKRDWKLGPHGRLATGFRRLADARVDDLVIDEAGRGVLVGTMRWSAGRGLVLARFVLGS
ncbi:MAG TPA: hypothetical protein VNO20_05265 [Solirubrobacterales bacterium]|nr:hypothetical protein [Solirubrobacterales bacterium]